MSVVEQEIFSEELSEIPKKIPVRRRRRRKKMRTARRVVGRVFAVVGVVLLAAIVLVVGAVTVICKGPSTSAAEVFVNTVMETSAAKFVARIYFSEDEVNSILRKYSVIETDEVTQSTTPFEPLDESEKGDIIVEEVVGPTFRGRMMIVRDPSRVQVAALSVYDGRPGKKVEEFYADTGAVAAINAGGFEDIGGVGNGGTPLGIVIHDSKLLYGSRTSVSSVIGFDQNNALVVGNMTGQEALDRGLRDAISFGPVFIVNGNAVDITGNGGGLNPRTVIGQRADGAVLLLVIDGRQASSLGASYKDCAQIMLDYGAINAANLDGGSSSMMMHNGEILNVSASLYGSRKLPNAIVVLPESKGE